MVGVTGVSSNLATLATTSSMGSLGFPNKTFDERHVGAIAMAVFTIVGGFSNALC
jgi:hypothetical protein